jgi:hypothetical protein
VWGGVVADEVMQGEQVMLKTFILSQMGHHWNYLDESKEKRQL